MERHEFERRYGGTMQVDLCARCQWLWFDDREHLELSPDATLALFRTIGQAPSTTAAALDRLLRCPRCAARLTEAHDQQRSTRFSYHRCRHGHGRLMPFFQFLKAKNFVRSLDARELTELRRCVRQVNCSNCGGPVDLERGEDCAFCGSPLAMLDPEQIAKTVAELSGADAQRTPMNPGLTLDLMIETLKTERAFADAGSRATGLLGGTSTDLVQLGMRALGGLF